MDNNNLDNRISEDIGEDLSLESILAEFKAEKTVESQGISSAAPAAAEAPREPSPRETPGFFTIPEGSRSEEFREAIKAADEAEAKAKAESEPKRFFTSRIRRHPKEALDGATRPVPTIAEAEARPAAPREETAAQKAEQAEPRAWEISREDGDGRAKYAPKGDYAPAESGPEAEERQPSAVAQLISDSAKRREEKRRERLEQAAKSAQSRPPELKPGKASELYLNQAQSLRLRFLFSLILCAALVYLSYGLPAFGALGDSIKVRSLVCLILELAVMVVGLDVISNGFQSLFRGCPGVESLISVSCLMSVIDAVVIVITGDISAGVPNCAVSALSVCFALLGSFLSCASYAVNFRVVALQKNPSVIVSHNCTIDGESIRVLSKLRRPATGFVRESEEADIFEILYSAMAPFLIIASIVLGLFCYFASESCSNLIRTISTCACVCASFSAILGFALPFSVLTKKLARSGAAIAGYSGCAELGRLKRVVITDSDLFPRRTVAVLEMQIEDGYYPANVISYTGSMIAAAGLGIAPAFTELMKQNGSPMQKVEDFACHAGGGVIAKIGGDKVFVGNASFMYLMGIRIRKDKDTDCTVYTAINDQFVGKFKISYSPMMSVTNALSNLLSGRTVPVFAIRDFNLTPMLVDKFFHLRSGLCDYPSFSDRYAVSSKEVQEDSASVTSTFAKGGLSAVAGLMRRGRRLYVSAVLCAVLSVLGTLVGIVLMLGLCWTGSFDSASCGNIMTFMLLWLVPVIVISWGLRR